MGQFGQAASLDSLQVATIDPAQQAALAEAAADPNSLAALGVGISGCDSVRWMVSDPHMSSQEKVGAKLKPIGAMTVVNTIMRAGGTVEPPDI